MGEISNEIPRIREARDHPPCRAVAFASAANSGQARRSQGHLLPLVRLLPERWAGGFAGSIATTEADLEQDSGRGPQPYPDPSPGGSGAVTARAGGALHRHGPHLRIGGFGLSPAQGA